MKCREMLKHLSDYLDRDLDPAICRHIVDKLQTDGETATLEILRATKPGF